MTALEKQQSLVIAECESLLEIISEANADVKHLPDFVSIRIEQLLKQIADLQIT